MRRKALTLAWLWLCLLLAGGPAAAQETAGNLPRLEYVEFSVGGTPRRIQAGGVLALHPDAPFRVLTIKTDGWLPFGLSARLPGNPGVDLQVFHTLGQILGDDLYRQDQVVVEALKNERVIGQVVLLARLLPIDWLRLAEAATSPEEKIRYTQKARELMPDDQLLARRLVDLLEEAHRYPEAAALLEEQTAGGRDPVLLRRLADLYERMGQPEREAAVLGRLLAESPGDDELLARLARRTEELERWEEAAELQQRLLEFRHGVERAGVYRDLARLHARAGQAEKAAAAWNQAVKLAPQDHELWRSLARARQEAGDPAGALEALKKAGALLPGDRDLLLALADAYQAQGDKRSAAESLDQVLRQDPDDLALLLRAAHLRRELGDQEELLALYERLHKLRPDDADLKFNLIALRARLAGQAGDPRKAAKSLDELANLAPDDQDIRARLAALHGEMGDRKAQLADYRRLAELDSQNPDHFYNLAVVASELNDPAQALAALEKADQLKPGDREIQEFMVALLLKLNDGDRLRKKADALMAGLGAVRFVDLVFARLEEKNPRLLAELLDLALRREPTRVALYQARAALALGQEDPQAAIAALERANQALPDNPELMLRLASLYEAAGQDQKALDLLGRLLDKNPNHPGAQERYLQIKTRLLGTSSAAPR